MTKASETGRKAKTGARRRSWIPLLTSIAVHAVLIWWLTGELEASLPRIHTPFVVDLVAETPSENTDVQSGQGRPEEAPGKGPAEEAPTDEDRAAAAKDEPEPTAEATGPDADPGASETESEPAVADPQELAGDALLPPAPDEVLPERSDEAFEVLQESLLSRSDPTLEVPETQQGNTSRGGSGVPAALGSAAGVTGPLGERALLHMELPEYPVWAERQGIQSSVRFRFWVSPDGHVIRIETKRRSAYPELESLAREALLRWRFAPLPRGNLSEEWGEVTVRWRLGSGDGAGTVTQEN